MGLAAMQAQLQAGWTTIRVMGDIDVHYANQDIRKVIEAGVFTGPRITGGARRLGYSRLGKAAWCGTRTLNDLSVDHYEDDLSGLGGILLPYMGFAAQCRAM